MNERIIGLDIGDVRIGIAVCDEARRIAGPVEVYKRVGYGPDTRHIKSICEKYNTKYIVCGLPLNMNGSEGPQSVKARDFGELLVNEGLVIFYQDERMSSVSAENAMIQGGLRREERRGKIDKVAAVIILQQWLDRGLSPESINNNKSEGDKMAKDQNQNTDIKNSESNESMEVTNSIIELVDEQGEATEFEHLMTIEHEDNYYIILMEVSEDDEANEDEGEVIILKSEKDDKDEDCYVSIEDEEILQAVFDKFIAAIEEEDDALIEGDDDEESEKLN